MKPQESGDLNHGLPHQNVWHPWVTLDVTIQSLRGLLHCLQRPPSPCQGHLNGPFPCLPVQSALGSEEQHATNVRHAGGPRGLGCPQSPQGLKEEDLQTGPAKVPGSRAPRPAGHSQGLQSLWPGSHGGSPRLPNRGVSTSDPDWELCPEAQMAGRSCPGRRLVLELPLVESLRQGS